MTYTPAPPPDWYPDPADPARQRWWSGQGWTDHLRDAAPQVYAAQAPVYAPAAYPAPEAPAAFDNYVPMGGLSAGGMQPYAVSAGISDRTGSPNTLPIWLLALSPVIFTATLVLMAVLSMPSAGLAIGVVIGGFLVLIVLIYWDSVALKSRNLPTPSAAWLLLGLAGIVLGLLAYLIARSVALAGVGRKNLAPTLVFGITFVGIIVLAGVLPFLMR